jgi:hypothetical protein
VLWLLLVFGFSLVGVDEGLSGGVVLALGLRLSLSLLGVDEGLLGMQDCDEALLLMEVVTVDVGSVESSLGVVVERADAENVPDEIFFPLEKVDSFQQELDTAPLSCGLTREMKVVEVGEHLGVLECIGK